MSCYLRHLNDVLAEAGLGATPDSRRRIDEVIHHLAGIAYRDCPATWSKLKEDVNGDEQKRRALIEELQKAIH